MPANEAVANHFKTRSIDKAIRFTSVEKDSSCQTDSHKISHQSPNGFSTNRKTNPILNLASFSSLRHELSSIKDQVNELLNDGPIRNSQGSKKIVNMEQSFANSQQKQLEELSDIRKSGKSTLSTIDDVKSQKSSKLSLQIENVRRQLKLSLERENKLINDKKQLLQQILKTKNQLEEIQRKEEHKNGQYIKVSKENKGLKNKIACLMEQIQAQNNNSSVMKELMKVKQEKQGLLKEIQKLKSEKQKQNSNYQKKIVKMNEKMNKYVSELRQKFEKEFKEKQNITWSWNNGQNFEIAMRKTVQEITKLKNEVKIKDREIGMMITDAKKMKSQQKMFVLLQSKLEKQKKIIDELNEELLKKQAHRISQKYANLE